MTRNIVAPGYNNVLTGFVTDDYVNRFTFDQEMNNFNNYGYAMDPSVVNHVVGQFDSRAINEKKQRRKRKPFGDPSDLSDGGYRGPWAPYEDEQIFSEQLKQETDARTEEAEIEAEEKSKEKPAEQVIHDEGGSDSEEEEDKDNNNKKTKREKEVIQAKSIYHGTQLKDYLGRTYVDPPTHLKNYEHECWLPKKQIHNWSGHTKGVNAIKFFPTYGHLILSASMDTKVKIWDVYNKMQCIRTYMGHSKAVRDICFSNDGRRFLSASYDRNILLWDTETGQCTGSFSNGKIPYCVKFNPDNDRQHIFLAGCSDKKVIQYDTRSGKIVQQYDQHLGPVNTITFVDNNRRFVTTSDDKSIRVWDFGIPVVIKYISEPTMHSMPSVAVSPDGKWLITQSLDNQIFVYSTLERFRIHKKKVFKGHTIAGYACEVGFSPDGRYVTSGDSDGRLFIWDWKSCKILKTLKCHQGVCIGAQWHPIEPSRVATCGWDGAVKYWD